MYIKRPRLAIVRISNGPDHSKTEHKMADHSKTEPKWPTIRKPNHSKTDFQNVRFSNGFGIRMFSIRALTVQLYDKNGY